jgi:hypothetical protein
MQHGDAISHWLKPANKHSIHFTFTSARRRRLVGSIIPLSSHSLFYYLTGLTADRFMQNEILSVPPVLAGYYITSCPLSPTRTGYGIADWPARGFGGHGGSFTTIM